jgi:chromosome segregation ATPase
VTGFTRRFQPEKPTTVGQAAIALASGEAAELLSEDLARLEAESMAEEAVRADIAMEVQAQKEYNQHHQEELLSEKAKREQVEAQIDGVRAQLENLISEREEEKSSILKDQATIDAEKRLLYALRNEVDAQLQALSTLQVEVATEKERLENLRAFREEELELIANFKAELEVERNALSLVRYPSSVKMYTLKMQESQTSQMMLQNFDLCITFLQGWQTPTIYKELFYAA